MSLITSGQLLIIAWEEVPPHELWEQRYDSRVVFSHAVLALTGMDVYQMVLDLDEYLVTPDPELQVGGVG